MYFNALFYFVLICYNPYPIYSFVVNRSIHFSKKKTDNYDAAIRNVYSSHRNNTFVLSSHFWWWSRCWNVMFHGSPKIVAVTRTRVLSLILCSGQQLYWGPTLLHFTGFWPLPHNRTRFDSRASTHTCTISARAHIHTHMRARAQNFCFADFALS